MKYVFLGLTLFFALFCLNCDAIFDINRIPKSILLISTDIGRDGGNIEYQKISSPHDGVAIFVKPRTIYNTETFGIAYFESFPNKPTNMQLESYAYEFLFPSNQHKLVKIAIPYKISLNPDVEGIAVFKYQRGPKRWHFGGEVSMDKSKGRVLALIDKPGIFAIMSRKQGMLAQYNTDFNVDFDNLNLTKELSGKYPDAASAYAAWFYREKKGSKSNLFTKHSKEESSLIIQAAEFAFFNSALTSSQELQNEADLSNASGFRFLKTALSFEKRPVLAVLDQAYLVVVYRFDNNLFYFYDPKEGSIEQTLTYDTNNNIYIYNARNMQSVALAGWFETSDSKFEDVFDYFEEPNSLISTDTIDNAGGSLVVTAGNLSGLEVIIPAGALNTSTVMEILELNDLPSSPAKSILLSTAFRLSGPLSEIFETSIDITIPYPDVNDDGIVDGTLIPEAKILAAAYNFRSASWAQAKIINRDTTNNTITCQSFWVSDYGLFGFEEHLTPQTTENSAVFIYHSWPSGEDEAAVISKLAQNRVRKLHISAFERTSANHCYVRFEHEANMSNPTGMYWTNTWFNYQTLIQLAQSNGIDIVLAITCWDPGNSIPVDDVDNQNSHAYFIVNTVVDFILEYCPEVSGIMLDYVRYDVGTYTEQEKDLVVKFLKRVREKIGRKGLNAPRLYVDVWCSMGEDGRDSVGQRYSDFAGLADDLVVMMYGGSSPPMPASDIAKYTNRGLMPCTPENGCKMEAAIQTYGLATYTTIDEQIDAALKNRADGFAAYRYSYTDTVEWQSIEKYCAP